MADETARIDTHPEPDSRMLGKWMSAAMVVGQYQLGRSKAMMNVSR